MPLPHFPHRQTASTELPRAPRDGTDSPVLTVHRMSSDRVS
jgi:hypothetical protein